MSPASYKHTDHTKTYPSTKTQVTDNYKILSYTVKINSLNNATFIWRTRNLLPGKTKLSTGLHNTYWLMEEKNQPVGSREAKTLVNW
jgi:hypothetical protein